MVKLEEITTDQMGRLYNKLVRMVNKSKTTVPETILVLRILVTEIERQFLRTISREK
jgi:hypothetical protein